ncbi:AAA family ATPase [Neisseria sp. Ec49-e6-T10]|uniref:AAA family ATPase n=1 Tax=Neisseria sp. Ec49-e6-T10 TaxID=3140744 RepID=UPI003EBBF1F0
MTEIDLVLKQLNALILGKQHIIKLALTCVLAKGHLLLEDVPGVGKTTLAHGLAKVLGVDYQRVQFTNDMLPADLLGVNVFEPQKGTFTFHPGPVFHRFLLADEINRASPKVQSALLEAMEERQVSVDGKTYKLPTPFMVVATQNPSEQLGTFVLPESQLDRFMMRISLGYPNPDSEKKLYLHGDRRIYLDKLKPVFTPAKLLETQIQVSQVTVSESIANYVFHLVDATRDNGLFVLGLSPRSGVAIMQAAKAWAFLEGRNFLLPEDIKAVFESVASHRLKPVQKSQDLRYAIEKVLQNVSVV